VRVGPRGFCAGVVRAVDIVELALEAYSTPVYVHHEIVHNRYVVEQLRQRGAIFVESVEDVPPGAGSDLQRARRAADGARRGSASPVARD
jgi:4-hydroxy-3-methylbut-2-en-1-yl diphosphate reductase